MIDFLVHDIESAPEGSKQLLLGLKTNLGMIPNLAAAMAESPKLLKGFLSLRRIFYSGSFTPAEIQVMALTNAFENRCEYCMALHSTMAVKDGVSEGDLAELRSGRPPAEPRQRALSDFSRKLVRERGHVAESDLQEFLDAGFTKAEALEVVLGVATSILPNFAHHLTRCAIDEGFGSHLWLQPSR